MKFSTEPTLIDVQSERDFLDAERLAERQKYLWKCAICSQRKYRPSDPCKCDRSKTR